MNRCTYCSNDILSLVEYQKCDDRALYENWHDPDTQKGYNGIYFSTFEEFEHRDSLRDRFFAMIQLNCTNEIIGAVGISPLATTPDLAIWMFKPYRKHGYGTSAFALATKYAVEKQEISELHAGAYADNVGSRKMLKKCGYIPYPSGNIPKKHYITGEDIVQEDFIYCPIYLRPATLADAEELAVMNRQLIEDEKHDNPMTISELEERMKGFLTDGYEAIMCTGDQSKTIGYALINKTAKPLYLRQFFINRNERRKGYGRRFFNELLEHLYTNAIDIEVMIWNEAGKAFWESLNFQPRSLYMRYGGNQQ